MRKFLYLLSLFVCVALASVSVSAQAEGIKPNFAAGDVTSVSSADNKIVLQTKDGAIDVVLSATSVFKRVPPDNPKLSAAVDATIADIGAGDKILVTGATAADKKSIPAKVVYLITKSDISKRQDKDREEWRTRGISGRIVSLDVPNKKIVLATRAQGGERNITLTPKDNADFRRYKPDSVKFDDAVASNYGALTVGDQVRALGDRSEDGMNFAAERIVSGSFKIVAGKITAVDAAKNEVTIKDVQTDKPLTISLNSSSVLKKFPAEIAAMMAGGMRGNAGGVQPPNGGARPGGMQGGAPGQGGGMRAGGRGEFDDMLERFPTIAATDLKPGDTIAVSGTTGAMPGRVTAIKLVSGVEPFLTTAQGQSGRGGQGGGQSSGFNIPGLDGIGIP